MMLTRFILWAWSWKTPVCTYRNSARKYTKLPLGKSQHPLCVDCLQGMGSQEKKIQKVAKQRCIALRAEFMVWVSSCSRKFLVWVDETGSDHRDHPRKYGYALYGRYPVYHRLLERGPHVFAIAAMSTDGVIAVDLHKGSVNGDVFVDFIRGSLILNMQQFDGVAERSNVILDTCSIHHIPEVIEMLGSFSSCLLTHPT